MRSTLSGNGKTWRIGLLAPRAFHFYAHEVVEGMRASRVEPGQRVVPVDLLYHREEEIPDLLKGCALDALILGLDRARYQDYSRHLPEVPKVNVHPDCLVPAIPTIAIAAKALAQATADYFASLGIRNCATVHTSTTEAQERVNRYLRELVVGRGGSFQSFELPGRGIVAAYESRRRVFLEIEEFEAWLANLDFPAGLLTSGGYSAVTTIRSAGRAGLSLPDSLSVLSRSDDNICLFTDPAVSSFRGVGPVIGEVALTVLIRHLNGMPLPKGEIGLPAPSVIERDSTGVPSGIDPALSAAVHYIRRNALKGVTIDNVLAANPGMSRSQLYRSFEEHFGNTPAQEIQRLRLAEAKSQLRFSRKSLSEIADACSFKTLAHFSTVFARENGQSPSQWRIKNSFDR